MYVKCGKNVSCYYFWLLENVLQAITFAGGGGKESCLQPRRVWVTAAQGDMSPAEDRGIRISKGDSIQLKSRINS